MSNKYYFDQPIGYTAPFAGGNIQYEWSLLNYYFQLKNEANFFTRFEETLKIFNFCLTRFEEGRVWGSVKTGEEAGSVFDETLSLELLTPDQTIN